MLFGQSTMAETDVFSCQRTTAGTNTCVFVKSTTADVINKDMMQNVSRTEYASPALSQEQGTF